MPVSFKQVVVAAIMYPVFVVAATPYMALLLLLALHDLRERQHGPAKVADRQ